MVNFVLFFLWDLEQELENESLVEPSEVGEASDVLDESLEELDELDEDELGVESILRSSSLISAHLVVFVCSDLDEDLLGRRVGHELGSGNDLDLRIGAGLELVVGSTCGIVDE